MIYQILKRRNRYCGTIERDSRRDVNYDKLSRGAKKETVKGGKEEPQSRGKTHSPFSPEKNTNSKGKPTSERTRNQKRGWVEGSRTGIPK